MRTNMQSFFWSVVLIVFLVCSAFTFAWAQGTSVTKPSQSPWSIPEDSATSPGIKGDTPQLESPTGLLGVKLNEYKENCLPLPDNFNEITSGTAYRAGTYSQAAAIIKSAPNPCEASVELKLFLEGQKGEWTLGSLASESEDMGLRVIVSAVVQKYIIGMAVNPTLTIGIKLSSLVDDELKKRSAAAPIKASLEMFRSTRDMNKDGIDRVESEIRSSISQQEKALDQLTVKYGQKLEAYRPSLPYNRLAPSTPWQIFFEKQTEFAREEAAERADLLYEIASLELQRNMLNKYRRPLIEKNCDQVMADLAKDCPGKNKPPDKTNTTSTPVATKDCSSLDDMAKTSFLGDLCRCSCNPTVGGGSKYDPAVGCVCLFNLGDAMTIGLSSSGECLKNSAASAGVNADSCKKTIDDLNKASAEKLLQKAKDLAEDFWTALPTLGLGKKGSSGAQETLKERVERKLSQGDLDQAEAYAKAAVDLYPPIKNAADAVIPGNLPWRLDKLAMSFLPSLDFGTSRRLLDRTIKLDEKNQQVRKDAEQVARWEEDWNQIKALSGDCFSLIKAKKVCACQRLFNEKIELLNKDFTLTTGRAVDVTFERSADEVRMGAPKLGTRSEMEQLPIPEKDALRGKLLLELDNARRACRYQPGMPETVGVLESYNADRTKPGRSDRSIADMASGVLKKEGLCDCERDVAEKALETANKWISQEEPPKNKPVAAKLDVSLMADRSVLTVGDSAYVAAAVTGGKPPHRIKWGGAVDGTSTTVLFKASRPGTFTIAAEATDTEGNKGLGSISITVEDKKTSTTEDPSHPDKTTKKNTTKTSTKIGRSRIITLGGNPETAAEPLKIKIPQGEQTKTLVFTYEHRRVDNGKMQFVYPPPSATTFMLEPMGGGASITRISNPAKWGEQKLYAVRINSNVRPGTTFLLTAFYSGIPLPPGAKSTYMDTGEDAEEYLKKNVKAASAVIEVVKSSSSSSSGTDYNPLDDANLHDPNKGIPDTAAVDQLGNDFQNTQKGGTDRKPKDNGTAPAQQPTTYTQTPKANSDEAAGQDGSQNIYYPSDRRNTGTDWTKWTTDHDRNTYHGTQNPSSSHASNRSSDSSSSGSNSSSQSPSSSASTSASSPEVIVKYTNASGENVHIFAEGQETFSLQNKLTPGKNRTTTVKVPPAGGFVKFISGRNGQKISECKWEYTPDSTNREPRVTFSDTQKLLCVTHLK